MIIRRWFDRLGGATQPLRDRFRFAVADMSDNDFNDLCEQVRRGFGGGYESSLRVVRVDATRETAAVAEGRRMPVPDDDDHVACPCPSPISPAFADVLGKRGLAGLQGLLCGPIGVRSIACFKTL